MLNLLNWAFIGPWYPHLILQRSNTDLGLPLLQLLTLQYTTCGIYWLVTTSFQVRHLQPVVIIIISPLMSIAVYSQDLPQFPVLQSLHPSDSADNKQTMNVMFVCFVFMCLHTWYSYHHKRFFQKAINICVTMARK